MPDYLIKDIPEDKMKEFKTACAYLQVTMRQDLLNAMFNTISVYQGEVAQFKRKQIYNKTKGG